MWHRQSDRKAGRIQQDLFSCQGSSEALAESAQSITTYTPCVLDCSSYLLSLAINVLRYSSLPEAITQRPSRMAIACLGFNIRLHFMTCICTCNEYLGKLDLQQVLLLHKDFTWYAKGGHAATSSLHCGTGKMIVTDTFLQAGRNDW